MSIKHSNVYLFIKEITLLYLLQKFNLRKESNNDYVIVSIDFLSKFLEKMQRKWWQFRNGLFLQTCQLTNCLFFLRRKVFILVSTYVKYNVVLFIGSEIYKNMVQINNVLSI